jgi:hypothetical protein
VKEWSGESFPIQLFQGWKRTYHEMSTISRFQQRGRN